MLTLPWGVLRRPRSGQISILHKSKSPSFPKLKEVDSEQVKATYEQTGHLDGFAVRQPNWSPIAGIALKAAYIASFGSAYRIALE